MSYVYQYIDSNTNLTFYIGKGTGSRKTIHLREAKARLEGFAPKGRPSFCVNKILSLLKQGIEPIVEVIQDGLSDDEAYSLEKQLVKKYGRRNLDENGILTNRAEGGLGSKGYKQTPEMIAALIERNHKQKGKPKPGLSAYIAANPEKHISRRQTGMKHTESRRASMAKTQRELQLGAKIFTFRSPSGEITRTKDWRLFLIEHDLSYNLVRGKGQIFTKGPNAGWCVIASEYVNR